MKFKTLLIALFFITELAAQNLFVRTFGDTNDPAVVFMHGGPGYNSASFEISTAETLARAGFYVVVYDRRGEGRSVDPNAAYTFNETFDDILWIYDSLNISTASLLGHSFGGIVSTKFALRYPEMVSANVMVGAPVSLQASFKTIIKSSRNIYKKNGDSVGKGYLALLEQMDTTSLDYSTYCFVHAMQNGFYTPRKPTKEAKDIYARCNSDSTILKYATLMDVKGSTGFWKNEQYTVMDLSDSIKALIDFEIPVYGLYGVEDGLYGADQIEFLRNQLGVKNFRYLKKCSHSVFIDQQRIFITQLLAWLT